MRALTCAAVLLLCAAALAQAPQQLKSFDLDAMDRSADPCVDFFKYACGKWQQNNPIPADQPSWGRSSELRQTNQMILRDLLEKAAVPDPKRSAVDQKIGDYYAACMDDKAVEAKKAQPLEAELKRIAAVKKVSELTDLVAHLHSIGVDAFFGAGSEPDFKDVNSVIAVVDQGGLGLPERDYYLKEDAKSVELRQKYVEHVGKMLQLLGDSPEQAKAGANAVMQLETALAKASYDVVKRRDPAHVYHKTSNAGLRKLSKSFAWERYFAAVGAPPVQHLNVRTPEFLTAMQQIMASTPLADIKTYLRWQLVNSMAPYLSSGFVNQNFEFNGKTVQGAKELRPRWKRCVSYTDNDLGEAVGLAFVDRTFGVEGKQRSLKMIGALRKSLGDDIRSLDWMSEATKQRALEKLDAVINKIGYPDKWRDYSSYNVVPGDLAGNRMRGNEIEFKRQLAKIGKPLDRLEWSYSPATVNASYNPQYTTITFPAGILQPPFYSNQIDDAVNLGGIGMVIGHELTHGFDDEGRQFDAQGNLNDWWTAEDGKKFEQKAQCFVDQYSQMDAVPGLKMNGKLTLGENAADNGGMRIAFMALRDMLKENPQGEIDGFTPEQRYFIGYGQIWCSNYRDEYARLLATTDPHSLGPQRVNGVVVNMPEFQQAFQCKAGQPMAPVNRCRVW